MQLIYTETNIPLNLHYDENIVCKTRPCIYTAVNNDGITFNPKPSDDILLI